MLKAYCTLLASVYSLYLTGHVPVCSYWHYSCRDSTSQVRHQLGVPLPCPVTESVFIGLLSLRYCLYEEVFTPLMYHLAPSSLANRHLIMHRCQSPGYLHHIHLCHTSHPFQHFFQFLFGLTTLRTGWTPGCNPVESDRIVSKLTVIHAQSSIPALRDENRTSWIYLTPP